MIEQFENVLKDYEEQKSLVKNELVLRKLQRKCKNELKDINLTPNDRVYLARHPKRPNATAYIDELFTDFLELKGDRLSGDDASILCGLANFCGRPVTVIAHRKGSTLEENVKYNFGMPTPSGYRKVQRIVEQAEKFNRPIITFIDTPGAYPGIEAEKQGQGEAIAKCLAQFSDLSVPVISVVIGEGGSGGALAIGVANTVIMLENSIYSILSPEGFASILWKDSSKKAEAAEIMKLTAEDLKKLEVIDYVVPEGVGSILINQEQVMADLQKLIKKELAKLLKQSKIILKKSRYEKFRKMGNVRVKEAEIGTKNNTNK